VIVSPIVVKFSRNIFSSYITFFTFIMVSPPGWADSLVTPLLPFYSFISDYTLFQPVVQASFSAVDL